MFGFFKKKGGEIPEEQQRQQRGAQEGQTRQDAAEVPQEFRALGQDFLPEELNILAVTGASGFGGGRSQGEKLWTASIGLTDGVSAGAYSRPCARRSARLCSKFCIPACCPV